MSIRKMFKVLKREVNRNAICQWKILRMLTLLTVTRIIVKFWTRKLSHRQLNIIADSSSGDIEIGVFFAKVVDIDFSEVTDHFITRNKDSPIDWAMIYCSRVNRSWSITVSR